MDCASWLNGSIMTRFTQGKIQQETFFHLRMFIQLDIL